MARFIFTCITCLVLCSGCFLDQKPPEGTQSPQSAGRKEGIVGLQSTDGVAQAASFIAGFFDAETDTTRSSRFANYRIWNSQWSLAPRATQCRVVNSRAEAKASKLYSAGTLRFGKKGSALIEVPEEASHRYSLKLDGDFPSGTYDIEVAGSSDVTKFQAPFSVPDYLANITVNGEALMNMQTAVDTNAPLVFAWDAIAESETKDAIFLDIVWKVGDALRRVQCDAVEQDLAVENGRRIYTIQPQDLHALPSDSTIHILLARATQLKLEDKALTLNTVSQRTMYGMTATGAK